jgi:hypothetical protein
MPKEWKSFIADVCRGNKTLTVVLFLSILMMMWHTHTLKENHTHTLHAVPWMGRVWASNRVKSVSLSSTWLQGILYASCFGLFKAIKYIESFELFIFISLESKIKVLRLRRTRTRYPGIRPFTIQPQHVFSSYYHSSRIAWKRAFYRMWAHLQLF